MGLWITEPSIIPATRHLAAGQPADAERFMRQAMPAVLRQAILDSALQWARSVKWLSFHATLLSIEAGRSVLEKLRLQLDLESSQGETPGLDILFSAIDEASAFEAAVQIDDDRLLKLAGLAAIRNPSLMMSIDPSLSSWRAIWLSRVFAGASLFDGIPCPAPTAHTLFDALRAGAAVSHLLIERVACDAGSDLCNYENRRDIWDRLPAPALETALDVTARDWLRRFLRDPLFDQPEVEPALRARVIECWRYSPELASGTGVCALWDRFGSHLGESDFIGWLKSYSGVVSRFESAAIGQLVARNRWPSAAKKIYDLLRQRRRPDLAGAMSECSGLLGFWERCSASFWTEAPVITEDEWWEKWLDLSLGLYPKGVEDTGIWIDADGDLSRIERGSGQEEWRQALACSAMEARAGP